MCLINITNINVSTLDPSYFGSNDKGRVWTVIEEPRNIDKFVKTPAREIDMKPGSSKAVSPERWKIIKTIHLIAPSNQQVNSRCISLFN
jgi:hypothetical protein